LRGCSWRAGKKKRGKEEDRKRQKEGGRGTEARERRIEEKGEESGEGPGCARAATQ